MPLLTFVLPAILLAIAITWLSARLRSTTELDEAAREAELRRTERRIEEIEREAQRGD